VNVAGLELALAMTDRLDELDANSSASDIKAAIHDASDMSRLPDDGTAETAA